VDSIWHKIHNKIDCINFILCIFVYNDIIKYNFDIKIISKFKNVDFPNITQNYNESWYILNFLFNFIMILKSLITNFRCQNYTFLNSTIFQKFKFFVWLSCSYCFQCIFIFEFTSFNLIHRYSNVIAIKE